MNAFNTKNTAALPGKFSACGAGRNRVSGVVCVALMLASGWGLRASETVAFVPADPSPFVGDWQAPKHVAQVFAIDGKWQANLLRAFDEPDAKPLAVLAGAATGEELTLSGDGWSGGIQNGQFTLQRGSESVELKHVTRMPPSLGARPPAGAVVLFDGRNLDSWVKKSGKDWLKPDGPAAWKLLSVRDSTGVKSSVMEIVPGTDSLLSKRAFGDCHVHLEFRTLDAPTNSGIYLQTRYEVNINETYGRLDGNANGGLDNCSEAKPRIRASRPPLHWQTLDIDFVAPRFDSAGKKTASARVTVLLNGVKIYDAQQLNPPKGAAGRLGEAATGPMMLQEHGQPVQFRNIWVLPK